MLVYKASAAMKHCSIACVSLCKSAVDDQWLKMYLHSFYLHSLMYKVTVEFSTPSSTLYKSGLDGNAGVSWQLLLLAF